MNTTTGIQLITTAQNTDFATLLRALPVSINNLADPAILRESTEVKLNTLVADQHTGPVAIITKQDSRPPNSRSNRAVNE